MKKVVLVHAGKVCGLLGDEYRFYGSKSCMLTKCTYNQASDVMVSLGLDKIS